MRRTDRKGKWPMTKNEYVAALERIAVAALCQGTHNCGCGPCTELNRLVGEWWLPAMEGEESAARWMLKKARQRVANAIKRERLEAASHEGE